MRLIHSHIVRDASESVVAKEARGKKISKGLSSYHLHHTKLSKKERGSVAAYKAAKEDVLDSASRFLDRWFNSRR